MTRVDGMRAVIMPSALPIPVAALGGESHVLPFIYFVFILYLFVFIGQPESSLCLPDAENPLAST